MKVIEEGEQVYGERGEVFEFVAALPDNEGYVVRDLFEADGEPACSRPRIVHVVYHEAPIERYEARVRELITLKSGLTEEVRRLRDEASAARQERAVLLGRLKEIEALKRIDDILEGRITHCAVLSDWRAAVVPLADVLKTSDEGGYPKPLKLLTLFGRTKGDLQWRVNCYSDGSGSSAEEVLLFPSEELATEALKDHTRKRLEFYAENLGRLYGAEKWVAIAKVFGLEIPGPVIGAIRAQKRSTAQKAKAEAISRLEAAEADLAAVEGD